MIIGVRCLEGRCRDHDEFAAALAETATTVSTGVFGRVWNLMLSNRGRT